ncbi:hypothetical protein PR048_000947 [Dryococelus australis]|uniref:Uncharacterized protein n=1 Tax=Dryococelus australis TaxID=614101 RepID=A0ABQ9IGX9_9NEOP|nr:hypothetical protein PR048_000947 [Dryococelus australis]
MLLTSSNLEAGLSLGNLTTGGPSRVDQDDVMVLRVRHVPRDASTAFTHTNMPYIFALRCCYMLLLCIVRASEAVCQGQSFNLEVRGDLQRRVTVVINLPGLVPPSVIDNIECLGLWSQESSGHCCRFSRCNSGYGEVSGSGLRDNTQAATGLRADSRRGIVWSAISCVPNVLRPTNLVTIPFSPPLNGYIRARLEFRRASGDSLSMFGITGQDVGPQRLFLLEFPQGQAPSHCHFDGDKERRTHVIARGFGRLLTARSCEPMKMIELSVQQRRNERTGKRDISEKTRLRAASSGMIPTCENPGGAGQRFEREGGTLMAGSCAKTSRSWRDQHVPRLEGITVARQFRTRCAPPQRPCAGAFFWSPSARTRLPSRPKLGAVVEDMRGGGGADVVDRPPASHPGRPGSTPRGAAPGRCHWSASLKLRELFYNSSLQYSTVSEAQVIATPSVSTSNKAPCSQANAAPTTKDRIKARAGRRRDPGLCSRREWKGGGRQSNCGNCFWDRYHW